MNMSITWFNEQPKDILVTLTPQFITLNKPGVTYFDNAHQVMLGYDAEMYRIFIKPLTKTEAIRGDIPEHARYNITINSSYGRITNKAFMSHIEEIFHLGLTDKGNKFKAIWNNSKEMLEVLLKEER